MNQVISPTRMKQLAALATMAKERGFSMSYRDGGLFIGLCCGPWKSENARFMGRYSYIKNVLEMFHPVKNSLTGFSLP